MILSLNRIRVFFEVASRGSFSAAAQALDYTPPAVSHHVSALERELGLSLVNRSERPWRLTPAGERLYRHAEAALAELALAEADLAAVAMDEAARVRIAAVPSALRSIVPRALAVLRERHPEVELVLAESQTSRILRELRGDELDVGVIVTPSGRPPEISRRLTATLLIEQPLVVAVPATSPLARRRRVALGGLRDQAWLLPSPQRVPDFRQEVDALFRAAGYAPKVALELQDDLAGQALVAAGLGIALVPALAATASGDSVRTIGLQPARSRALYLLTARRAQRRPVTTLIEQLQIAAEEWTWQT